MKASPVHLKPLKTIAVIALVLLQTALMTACFYVVQDFQTETLGTSRRTTATTPASETTGTSAPATQATSAVTASPQDFQADVTAIILDGLEHRKRSISIDQAIEPRSIPEGDIEAAIDLVFAAYQDIYISQPEFFYLNGSINVSYSKQGTQGYLASMTVKPEYWDSMAGLSDAELDSRISEVESVAGQLSSSIAGQTDVPWKQLLLLHDWLVLNLEYDQSQDQWNNNVYSALAGKITLCQGYAQSFQLVARRLGFDVSLAVGTADGIGHAWNIVRLDGKYYHIDVTFDDPVPDGGTDTPVGHVHFLRSDSQMAVTHSWKRQDYPSCPEDGAHFYRRMDLTADSFDSLAGALETFAASIDYSRQQINRLELLYSGSKPPDASQLEDMVRSALLIEAPGYSVHFSHQIYLGVVTVDIIPD